MLFDKEILQELACDGFYDGYEVISDVIKGTSRWSIHYELVFKFEGRFYRTSYSVGATECQDERPFENSLDRISCVEVFPVEKTVIVYEPKEQDNG